MSTASNAWDEALDAAFDEINMLAEVVRPILDGIASRSDLHPHEVADAVAESVRTSVGGGQTRQADAFNKQVEDQRVEVRLEDGTVRQMTAGELYELQQARNQQFGGASR